MRSIFIFIILATAYLEAKDVRNTNITSTFNDVIILSSKNLNCHSCSNTNAKSPECTCKSSKCILKSFSNNSTQVSDRSCTDEKWVNNLLYDGCLTYGNKYWCVCSSDYCNSGNITAIRGNDDCSSNPCPLGSTCLDTLDGFKCMCAPWEPSCTYSQPANCPCKNGGLCVQLPHGTLGCSCRYGFTGEHCDRISKKLLRKRALKNSKLKNDDENEDILNLSSVDMITIDEDYDLDIEVLNKNSQKEKSKIVDAKFSDVKNEENEYDYYDSLNEVKNEEEEDYYDYYDEDNYDDYDMDADPDNPTESLTTSPPDYESDTPNNFYIDPCEPNPCNSGKCERKEDDFKCRCPPGSYGKLCHLSSFGVCPEVNPCQNNGICIDSDPIFKCICHADFYGTFCDKKIDQCLFNNPCKNNATCQFVNGSIKCKCQYGYTGAHCEKRVCDDKNPCMNNGVCIMDIKYVNYDQKERDLMGVKCSCKPGYEGNRCEKVRYVIGCPPINPCLNNGRCVDKPFGFQCICPRKYSGKRCELEKPIRKHSNLTNKPNSIKKKISDICHNRKIKCKNKGVCLTTVRGVKCQCLPEYTGQLCEYRIHKKKDINDQF